MDRSRLNAVVASACPDVFCAYPLMPRVFIPVEWRLLTGGNAIVEVAGTTVREVVNSLESRFPGTADQLLQDDRIRPGLSVVIDSRVSTHGLREAVEPDSEIQFLPSISGG